MKFFKTLGMYCIMLIFVMSLTSSFELSSSDSSKFAPLSIKGEKMHQVFYNNPDEIIHGDKVDKEDSSPNTTETIPPETVDTSKVYQTGDSGEEVFAYQKLLYYLDYIETIPDGNFGEGTKTAVEDYQQAKNMEATGNLDSQTQQALLSEQIEYKTGKTGDEIKDFQMVLYYLDYLKTYPEGEYGSGTETAVRTYQTDKSLEVTGTLNKETQTALKEEKPEFKAGKRGPEIKEYQSVLITLGYLSGNPDGHLGTISVNAIKQYQEKNNLEQTGNLDTPTQTSLKKPIEEQIKF